jgi:hypothetical protein
MSELVTFALPALPLLALLLALLLGHYPGCETIVRIAERIARDLAPREAGRSSTLPKPPRSFAPGGGLLIALGLAQRPPPVAA